MAGERDGWSQPSAGRRAAAGVPLDSATLASEYLSVVVAKQEGSRSPASASCIAAVDATMSKAVGVDEGVPIRGIAEVIGRDLPPASGLRCT
jgi:hypothetical protein